MIKIIEKKWIRDAPDCDLSLVKLDKGWDREEDRKGKSHSLNTTWGNTYVLYWF